MRIFNLLSFAAGLVACFIIGARVINDLGHVASFGSAAIHALAFTAFAVDFGLRGYRMTLLLALGGARVPLAASVAAQLAGDAGGAVTPAKLGSDPAKFAVLRLYCSDIGVMGAALLAEILIEAAALLVVSLVALWLLGSIAPVLGAAAYAAMVVVTGGAALWLARDAALRERITRWLRLRASSRLRFENAIADFSGRLHEFRHIRVRTLLLLCAVTFAHIAARLAILPALAGDVAVGNVGELIAWPLLLLYGGTFLPTPGGAGLMELAFAGALAHAIPPSHRIATMVWWRIYTFYLSALIGGMVLLWNARRNIPRPLPA